MKTPTFKNVTTENYPIDNFMVQNATDAATTIQVLDTAGQSVGTYYWYNEYEGLPAGWFDALGNEPANIELAPGEAVLFNTNESGVSIQSAGEVPGEITHTVSGYMMIGNGSPVNVEIDDVVVNGATDAATTIQVLDTAGQSVGTYYWYNEYEGLPAGWFDALGNDPAGITLAPGESLLFNSNETGVTVTIPSAI